MATYVQGIQNLRHSKKLQKNSSRMPTSIHAGDGVGQRCQAPRIPVIWAVQCRSSDARDPASEINAGPKIGRPFASAAAMPAARTTEEKGTITKFASGEIQLIRLKLKARSGSSQS